MITRNVRKAFTLVEILIVVVILGILAAIVIPQFTRASEDAQVSNVESQLQTIRSQIELFRVRNNGQAPALGTLGATGWGDPAGAAAADRGLLGEEFLRTPPINPRTGTSNIVAGVLADSEVEAVAGAADAWIYDSANRTVYCIGFNEDFRTDGSNDPWFPVN